MRHTDSSTARLVVEAAHAAADIIVVTRVCSVDTGTDLGSPQVPPLLDGGHHRADCSIGQGEVQGLAGALHRQVGARLHPKGGLQGQYIVTAKTQALSKTE